MFEDVIDRLKDNFGPGYIIQMYDPASGMRAVIVIDTAAFGPAAGGIRMLPDITTEEIAHLAIDSQNFLVFCGGFAYFSWVFLGWVAASRFPRGFFSRFGGFGGPSLSWGGASPFSSFFLRVSPL
ncbi:MAG: hypothetical protein ACTSUQ_01810 [Candidatus Freyarchaeota archaeon]